MQRLGSTFQSKANILTVSASAVSVADVEEEKKNSCRLRQKLKNVIFIYSRARGMVLCSQERIEKDL